jgi:hypothetical protein
MIYNQNLKVLYLAYVKEHVSKLIEEKNRCYFIKKIDCICHDEYVYSLSCDFDDDQELKGYTMKTSENMKDLIVVYKPYCLRVFVDIEKNFYDKYVDVMID